MVGFLGGPCTPCAAIYGAASCWKFESKRPRTECTAHLHARRIIPRCSPVWTKKEGGSPTPKRPAHCFLTYPNSPPLGGGETDAVTIARSYRSSTAPQSFLRLIIGGRLFLRLRFRPQSQRQF